MGLQRLIFYAFALSAVCLALIKHLLGYWKRRGILHEKPKFLWGNVKGVISGKHHLLEVVQAIYDSHKGRAPFVGCYALLKPFIMVLDLELVQNILVSDAGYFTSRGLFNNVKDEPLSGNLLQLDGHKWRQLHAKSVEVFSSRNINKLFPQLLQVCNKFDHRLSEKKLNVSELVDEYNVEMIASLGYGVTGDELDFRDMTRNCWNNFVQWRAYLALEFPMLARLLQYKSYAQVAMDYFYNLVQRQLFQQRQRDRQPLQSFLQLYTGPDVALSDAEVAAQAFAFILAGLTPLNATLGFALYELALKPELQERVREEIKEQLAQSNGKITVEFLKELKYTKQVLNETLRLHTPYPILLRRATKEFELKKSVFMIARGNNIVIPVTAIHRDPAIYPDPLRFDPDRFEAEAIRARPAMAFIPFGDGLRGCIAKQLADQQLLLGLVTLLRHHRFSPCADTQIPLQYDNKRILLSPKQDIQLCVECVDS